MKPVILFSLFSLSLSLSPSAIEETQIAIAEARAGHFLSLLPAPPSLQVRFTLSSHPNFYTDAVTVRATEFYGCVVHIRREKIFRTDIIAHETCHCVFDYSYLTPYGYKPSVTEEMWRAMERRAEECEGEVTAGREFVPQSASVRQHETKTRRPLTPSKKRVV